MTSIVALCGAMCKQRIFLVADDDFSCLNASWSLRGTLQRYKHYASRRQSKRSSAICTLSRDVAQRIARLDPRLHHIQIQLACQNLPEVLGLLTNCGNYVCARVSSGSAEGWPAGRRRCFLAGDYRRSAVLSTAIRAAAVLVSTPSLAKIC